MVSGIGWLRSSLGDTGNRARDYPFPTHVEVIPFDRSVAKFQTAQTNDVAAAVILAEVLRGGAPDIQIHRLLPSVYVQVIHTSLAKAAGARSEGTKTPDRGSRARTRAGSRPGGR